MKTVYYSEVDENLVVISFYTKNGKRYKHQNNSYRFEGNTALQTDILWGSLGYCYNKHNEFKIVEVGLPHPKTIKENMID